MTMNKFVLRVAVAALFVVGVFSAASFAHAQESRTFGGNVLPDGEGRDIVAIACSQCHGLNAFTWLRQGQQAWRHQVYDMILRGTQISPSELDTVVAYLATNFGPGVNVPQSARRCLAGWARQGDRRWQLRALPWHGSRRRREALKARMGGDCRPDGLPGRATYGRSGEGGFRVSQRQFRLGREDRRRKMTDVLLR